MQLDLKTLADGLVEVVKDSVAKSEVALLATINVVNQRIDQLPSPKQGEPGVKGDPGEDGKSFTVDDAKALIEPEFAKWALDFERRAQDVLQRTIDRMPPAKNGEPGKNGIDAIGFDDLSVEHDGERSFTVKFDSGDRCKEFKFSLPVVLDRGYFREGEAFEKGDGVTFGGSYWIAQGVTQTKPEIGNPDWRLAVKKGRDAKTPALLGDVK